MPPVEHSVSWHDAIRIEGSVCHAIGVLRLCFTSGMPLLFRLTLILSTSLFFLFVLLKTFQSLRLSVRFRVSLWVSFRVSVRVKVGIKVTSFLPSLLPPAFSQQNRHCDQFKLSV